MCGSPASQKTVSAAHSDSAQESTTAAAASSSSSTASPRASTAGVATTSTESTSSASPPRAAAGSAPRRGSSFFTLFSPFPPSEESPPLITAPPAAAAAALAVASPAALSRRLSQSLLRSESAAAAATTSATTDGLSPQQRELLLLAYAHGGLQFGSFKLKSGRMSPFFFNSAAFNNGQSMEILAKGYAAAIVQQNLPFDALFGPAYKGIPVVACTSMVLARDYGLPAPFVYDRKEQKDHGEGGQLVGALEAFHPKPVGRRSSMSNTSSSVDSSADSSNSEVQSFRPARVLLVDDVLSAGVATRQSISILKKNFPDVEVVGVCLLLNRQERSAPEDELTAAQKLEAEFHLRVFSVLTMENMVTFLNELISSGENLESKKFLQKSRNDLLEYRRLYGAVRTTASDLM